MVILKLFTLNTATTTIVCFFSHFTLTQTRIPTCPLCGQSVKIVHGQSANDQVSEWQARLATYPCTHIEPWNEATIITSYPVQHIMISWLGSCLHIIGIDREAHHQWV